VYRSFDRISIEPRRWNTDGRARLQYDGAWLKGGNCAGDRILVEMKLA
jgi:hypothetical protein